MFRIFSILLFPLMSLSIGAKAQNNLTPESVLDMKAVEISKNIYVLHGINQNPTPDNQGLIANLGFVIDKDAAGVIVIESGGSQTHGKLLIKEIEKITALPIIAVFNTHIHGDHWLGNNAIRKRFPNTIFYASKNLIEQAQSGVGGDWVTLLDGLTNGAVAGTRPHPATQPLSNGDKIQFGKVALKILINEVAHTATDIIVSVEQDSGLRTVFLGDIGLHQRIGRMDDGNFKGNIDALDRATALKANFYVPGHGPTTRGVSSAQLYRDYLSTLYAETERWYEEGLSDFEIKKKIRPKFKPWEHWEGFEDAFGRHVSLIYLEIEEASF